MNETLKIKGGKALSGHVRVASSKNAAVAILPAVVLASEVVKLYDTPYITDINALIQLLQALNIKVIGEGNILTIDPTEIKNTTLQKEDVRRLRASYYFMGALLGRFNYVKMASPGGCNLGPRPIDLHLKGFEALGAKVKHEDGCIEISAPNGLVGDEIYLDISSVGATINIMLAAVFAKGRTVILNAAKEPEIIDLSSMLNKMGANIKGAGTSRITIDGVHRLKGCVHDIIPDRIEAGTYIIMGACIGKNLTIDNVIPQHIGSLLLKLEEMGVKYEQGIDYVKILDASNLKAVDIKTLPYPGFATDLQAPITPLLLKANGDSKVKETIYLERFKHCEQLNKMGANCESSNGYSIIHGPCKLKGTKVTATDLRCGAALVIAALMADGETEIADAYHIYRGYDSIVDKLKAIGADVE